MKSTQRLILFIVGLIFLAACTAEISNEPQVELTVEKATSTDLTDLTLIGQTGRPQFLNAYASW